MSKLDIASIDQQYPMSIEGIRVLVDCFYVKIQKHTELSPVFAAAIGKEPSDWKPHLEKMYNFWGMIMLGVGEYKGNPLKAHISLPPFPESYFDKWLELFAETADEVLVPTAAELFKNKSQKMALVLKRGIYTK